MGPGLRAHSQKQQTSRSAQIISLRQPFAPVLPQPAYCSCSTVAHSLARSYRPADITSPPSTYPFADNPLCWSDRMGVKNGPTCSDTPQALLPALPLVYDVDPGICEWTLVQPQQKPTNPVIPIGTRPARPRGPRGYLPPGTQRTQIGYSPDLDTPCLSDAGETLYADVNADEAEPPARQIPWQPGHRRRPSTPFPSPLTPLTLNTMDTPIHHRAGPVVHPETIRYVPRVLVPSDAPSAVTPKGLLPSPLPPRLHAQLQSPSDAERSLTRRLWDTPQTRRALEPIVPLGPPPRRRKQRVASKSDYRMPLKATKTGPLHSAHEVQRQAIKLQQIVAEGGGRRDEEEELDDEENMADVYRKRVWFGDWCAGRTVGAGISGSVAVSRNWQTGRVAALKMLSLRKVDQIDDPIPSPSTNSQYHGVVTRKGLEALEREIAAMKLVSHENVIRMWDSFEDPFNLYLLLEYVQGGELFDLLVSRGHFGPDEGSYLFQQIAAAVGHLHKLNIVHRDLKPENILVTRSYRIKLADFGMVSFRSGDWKMETACGSPHYAAPEVMAAHDYAGPSADIWSIGVLLYAIVVGRLPFDDQHGDFRVLVKLVEAGVFHMPETLVPDVKDLIWRILVKEPAYRLKMSAIVTHPFCQRQFVITRERLIQLERDMGLKTLRRLDAVTTDVDDGNLAAVVATTSSLLTTTQIKQSVQLSREWTWEKEVHTLIKDSNDRNGLARGLGKFELFACDGYAACDKSSFDDVSTWLPLPADPGPLQCDEPPQRVHAHHSRHRRIGSILFEYRHKNRRKATRVPVWIIIIDYYRPLDLGPAPLRRAGQLFISRSSRRRRLRGDRRAIYDRLVPPSRQDNPFTSKWHNLEHSLARQTSDGRALSSRRVAPHNEDLPLWALDFVMWQNWMWEACGPCPVPVKEPLLSGWSGDADPSYDPAIGQRWTGCPEDWAHNPYYRPNDLHERRKRAIAPEGFDGTMISGGEPGNSQEAAKPGNDVSTSERISAVSTAPDVVRGQPLSRPRPLLRQGRRKAAFSSYGESEHASGFSQTPSTDLQSISTAPTVSTTQWSAITGFSNEPIRPLPCPPSSPPARFPMSRGPLPSPPLATLIQPSDLEWSPWHAIDQLMPPASPLPLLDAFGTPQPGAERQGLVISPWSPPVHHSSGPSPRTSPVQVQTGPAPISQIPAVQPRRSPALTNSTPKQASPTVETPHAVLFSPAGPIGTPRQPVYPAVHRSSRPRPTPLVHPTPRRAYQRVPAVPLGGREPGERRAFSERPSPALHYGFVPPPPAGMLGGNRQPRPPPLPLTQLSPDPATPSMLVWSPSDTPNLSTLVTPVLGYNAPHSPSLVLQEVPGAVPQRGWVDKALGTSPLYFEFVSPQDCTASRAECTRLLRSLGAVVQMEDAEGWGHLKVSVSEVRDITGIVINKSARLKLGFIPKQHRSSGPPLSPQDSAMASPRSTGMASSSGQGLHSVITMLHERGSTDAFLAVYSRLKADYGQSARRASMIIPPPTFAAIKRGSGPPNGLGMPKIAYLDQELQDHQEMMITNEELVGYRPS